MANAKERRLARRQAAREQQERQVQDSEPPVEDDSGIAEPSSSAPTTAKERRLARRKAAREQLQSGTSEQQTIDGPTKGTTSGTSRSKRKLHKQIPNIVFVGQLSYSTTAQQLEDHFKTNGIHGPIKVRMLTDKKTKKFKGTAFVEFANASEMYKSLSMHHSHLGGRRINVERSCGGKDKTRKKQKLSELKQQQTEAVEATIQRILKEYTDKDNIKKDEFNDTLMERLVRYDGKIVEEALKDYIEQDKDRVQNRTALFVSIVRTHDEEKRKEEEAQRKKEAANQKAAKIFGVSAKSDGNSDNKGSEEYSESAEQKGKHKKAQSNKSQKKKKKQKDDDSKNIFMDRIGAKPIIRPTTPSDLSALFPSMKGRGGGQCGKKPGRGHR
mmetsp:Transcript_2301/g.3205  ORF Transcript_2301/g.3205 Transcript_2301/m.3205 type:complete len:384 (-) Transcript_2301:260-1411(-)